MEPVGLPLIFALVYGGFILGLPRSRMTCIAVVALWLGTVPQAFAACEVNDTAQAYEVTKLKWTTLGIPTSGSHTCIVAASGSACGAGSTGAKIYGTISGGVYDIIRDNDLGSNCTITIDIVNIVTGSPNLTLSSFTGTYDGVPLAGAPPWSGLPKPAFAGKELRLGATATYTSALTPSTLTPTFGIKITFAPNATGTTTSAMTASAVFDSPLTIGSVVDINFGTVKGNNLNVYTINTAGTVTPSNGGAVYGGATNAGSMLIHGSSSQTVSIATGGYVGGTAGGATVQTYNGTCAYNGGAEVACESGITLQAAPGSAGKTLLLGVSVQVFGNSTGGTATPSFTVTVTYT